MTDWQLPLLQKVPSPQVTAAQGSLGGVMVMGGVFSVTPPSGGVVMPSGAAASTPASTQASPVTETDFRRTTGRSCHSSPAPAPLGCTKIDFLPSKSMVTLPSAQAGQSN